MLLWILVGVVIFLAALTTGLFWLVFTLVRRIETQEFALDDAHRQAFADLQTMFGMQEILDEQKQKIADAHFSLEMVLNDR